MKPRVAIFRGKCVLLWPHREPEILTTAEAHRLASHLLVAALHVEDQEETRSVAQLLKNLRPVGEA